MSRERVYRSDGLSESDAQIAFQCDPLNSMVVQVAGDGLSIEAEGYEGGVDIRLNRKNTEALVRWLKARFHDV